MVLNVHKRQISVVGLRTALSKEVATYKDYKKIMPAHQIWHPRPLTNKSKLRLHFF